MYELELIKTYYGDRVAKRSGVPYINHITEGLEILDRVGANSKAKRAFCLHPLLQADEDLLKNWKHMYKINNMTLILAMEYRRVANNYLPSRRIQSIRQIELSPLSEVNYMLYADKVQNKKDFMIYHFGTHENSDGLLEYFDNWIRKLEMHLNINP